MKKYFSKIDLNNIQPLQGRESVEMKDRIRRVLSRYVNQRNKIYAGLRMDLRPAVHLKAIGKIKQLLEWYKFKNFNAHIELVIQLEDSLTAILPATTSKFHDLRSEIEALINYCKEQKQFRQ